MSNTQAVWADSDVRLEVAIEGPPRSIGVRAYTQLLEQVLLSLEEIDRFALPGRTPRIDWAVEDLAVNGEIRAVIAPKRTPLRRPPGTVAAPAMGLVAGVVHLREIAEIPELFSPLTVERVQNIGRPIGENGIDHVEIRHVGPQPATAVVDRETVDHARKAVSISRTAFGSLVGRLDVLTGRSRTGPRAQVLIEGTRQAVTVRAAPDQANLLREAWQRRVAVSGELRRNSAGQPIQLDLTELAILPERLRVTAWDILGIAPNWTGDLTTEEFVRQARRG
ncbi:hypothetical protein ABZ754_27445 [Micromonospora purpureochromogenes]|uniref:hypothetical protein n=1 Tax=Micromonospora purpureochromogenes TaxID=47872 RepID=UPI0033C7A2D4